MSITPVVIDPVNVPEVNWSDDNFAGPLERNGKLYVIAEDNFDAATAFARIYKSSDGGKTWSVISGASSPVNTSGWAYYWNGGAQIVFCFSSGTGLPVNLVKFNIDTETWSAVFGTSGGFTPLGSPVASAVVQLSTGAIRVFYGAVSGGQPAIEWGECADGAGAWTSTGNVYRVLAVGDLDLALLGTAVDSADTIHTIIETLISPHATNDFRVFYNTLSSGGVAGSEVQFNSALWNERGAANRIVFTAPSSLWISGQDFNQTTAPAGSPSFVGIWQGSIPPTWALTDVFNYPPPPSPADVAVFTFFLLSKTGIPTIFWVGFTAATNSQTRVYFTQFVRGVWTAPVLYYDLVTDPPIPAATGDIEGLSVSLSDLNPSGFGVVLSVGIDDSTGSTIDTPVYLLEKTFNALLTLTFKGMKVKEYPRHLLPPGWR